MVSINQVAAKTLLSNPRVCYAARKGDRDLEGPEGLMRSLGGLFRWQSAETQKSLNTIEMRSKNLDFVLLNLRGEPTIAVYD